MIDKQRIFPVFPASGDHGHLGSPTFTSIPSAWIVYFFKMNAL